MTTTISKFLLLLLTIAGAASAQVQLTTVRIRFVNGKSGKPLHLKSYDHSEAVAEAQGSYAIERIEGDSMFVSFKNTSNFYFRSELLEPCDSKSPKTDQPKYDLKEIVERGVVAPNYCGHTHGQPKRGELVIYSRHEHWWDVTKRVAKGLLICA